jgi:rhamnosyltransferase
MRTNQSIAVLLHVYYTDMLDEIFLYLKNLNHPFDLYVNLTTGYEVGSVEKIKGQYPEAIITISPNKGVDVGGFYSLLKNLKRIMTSF